MIASDLPRSLAISDEARRIILAQPLNNLPEGDADDESGSEDSEDRDDE